MKYDHTKAIANIKVKHSSKDGNYTVRCEVDGCDQTTPSSKMHGWHKDRWITCPSHEQRDEE